MNATNSNAVHSNSNANTHLLISEYVYTIRPTQLPDLPHLPAIERSAAALFTSIPDLCHLADDEPMSVEAHWKVIEEWRNWRLNVGDKDGKFEGGSWVVVARRDGNGGGDDGTEATEGAEQIVGFVVTELLPLVHNSDDQGNGTQAGGVEGYFLHINELSIATSHQRRGLARRLLDTVKDFAVKLSSHPSTTISPMKASSLEHSALTDHSKPRPNILSPSLTTFRNVPFNAPFYEKFGFREVERGNIERVVGVEGTRIWKEDCGRFEGGDGDDFGSGGGFGMRRRCWMVCWL